MWLLQCFEKHLLYLLLMGFIVLLFFIQSGGSRYDPPQLGFIL